MLTEKQKEIAEKAFRVEWDKPGGTIRNCIRAAVEAVLTAQPAAQPFRVTMEEAEEIQIAYHADRSPESIEAWQRYINAVLARLTTPQEPKERKGVKDLLCARISGQNVCFDADGYDANIIEAYRRGRAEIGEKK